MLRSSNVSLPLNTRFGCQAQHEFFGGGILAESWDRNDRLEHWLSHNMEFETQSGIGVV